MLAVQIMNLTLRDETLTTDIDKNRGQLGVSFTQNVIEAERTKL